MVNGKPVWTFSPNWENGVVERLEWVTDILASVSGAEQRRCMRLAPRREFAASFLLQGRDRAYFDVSTFMAGGIEWYLPLWAEVVRLTTPVPAGSGALPIDPANREFRVGDYVLLLGQDAFTYETVQIHDTVGGSLQLIANTINSWPIGTRVYPLRVARYSEQPKITKHTDTFIELAGTFKMTEADSAPAAPSLTTYQGYPVFNARPDESEDLTGNFQRKMATLDGQTGLPKFTDMAGRGFTGQQYKWAIAGRAAYAEFRRVLYAIRGRWKTFWAPTFMQDMTPTRDIAAADTFIYIQHIGYTDYGAAVKGRDHIRIEKNDGTYVYAQIGGSVIVGDEEKINLTAAVGADIPAAAIRSISYLVLTRLNDDTVELSHETDGDGLTLCSVEFQSAPDLRNATEWSPPPILSFTGSPNGCMPPCPLPLHVQDDNIYTTSGDYNPMTNEIWSSSYVFNVAGNTKIGSRYRADTLAHTGDINAANIMMTVDSINSGASDPCFVFDTSRGCAWTIWNLKVGGLVKTYILKIDATTGEVLNCVNPTGTGVYNTAQRNVIWVNPTTGELWLLSASGTSDTYIHKLGEGTLLPVLSYHQSGLYLWDSGGILPMNVRIDNDGHVYFIARAPAGGTQVWKFNTITNAFSVAYTAPSGDFPNVLAVDTSRNQIIVALQVSRQLQRLATGGGSVVGVLDQPSTYQMYESGDPALAYDATNDVLWGFTYSINSGRGRITGVHVGTNTAWGYFDPELQPTMNIDNIFYGMTVPRPGQPNAIYITGQTLPADTFGLFKIPVCNVIRGNPPNPV